MTAGELVAKLSQWSPDIVVKKSDDLDNFHDITSVDYWTAYDQAFVVLD